MSKSIIVMPETDDVTFCATLAGLITAEDYKEYFDTPLRRMAASGIPFNLFVLYGPEFIGWTKEAADLSFKCVTDTVPYAGKLAYINPPDSKRLLMKIVQDLTHATIRHYDLEQADEAMNWVKEKHHEQNSLNSAGDRFDNIVR